MSVLKKASLTISENSWWNTEKMGSSGYGSRETSKMFRTALGRCFKHVVYDKVFFLYLSILVLLEIGWESKKNNFDSCNLSTFVVEFFFSDEYLKTSLSN